MVFQSEFNFEGEDLFQLYNMWRGVNDPHPEKVLRTYGTKKHCEEYKKKWNADYLTIEPYNADEWQHPKTYSPKCVILPYEKIKE